MTASSKVLNYYRLATKYRSAGFKGSDYLDKSNHGFSSAGYSLAG